MMLCARDFRFPLGKRTYVMGVLNYTADSFSDGGLYNTPEAAAAYAQAMQAAGADIIDLGAQSTRPDAELLTCTQELERLEPALAALRGNVSVPLSVDTFYPACAKAALESGVAIINDISGEFNGEMAALAKDYGAAYIVTHNPCGAGMEATYPDGVVNAVRQFFLDALNLAAECGLPRTQLCLDIGLGFGKSYEDQLTLLRELEWLKFSGVALVAAASRKRFIGAASGEKNPQKRDPGTVAAHTAAIAGGADIIRAHNVAAAVQGARMADAIYRS
ncbi:MAG: dihydropteroate synthase [Clostridia bacterium]|nr:dihydropteroate synthase [Clostridia bacterium]